MAERSVRRPTEDIALARVTAQKGKGPQGDPTLLQKTVMGRGGIKYLISCFHTTVNISIACLWCQWCNDWEDTGMTFVDFLLWYGIIFRYTKI